MRKPRRTTVRNPMYAGQFEVLICTHQQLKQFMQKQYGTSDIGKPSTAKSITMGHTDGSSHHIVWFNERWNSRTPDGINTLTHECFHTTQMFLKVRGMPNRDILGEAGAYFCGWLAEEITLWDRKKRR